MVLLLRLLLLVRMLLLLMLLLLLLLLLLLVMLLLLRSVAYDVTSQMSGVAVDFVGRSQRAGDQRTRRHCADGTRFLF